MILRNTPSLTHSAFIKCQLNGTLASKYVIYKMFRETCIPVRYKSCNYILWCAAEGKHNDLYKL